MHTSFRAIPLLGLAALALGVPTAKPAVAQTNIVATITDPGSAPGLGVEALSKNKYGYLLTIPTFGQNSEVY